MKRRKIVKIDKNKCIGCGTCASVCPEGFEIINGKARIKNSKALYIKEEVNACPVSRILVEK